MPAESSTARTFILRVWREPGAPGDEWRGEVKTVPAGETAYFRTWNGLPALMRRLLDGEGTGNRE